MNIRTYARTSRPNKDKTISVYFEYKRRPFFTGEKVFPKAWNQKANSVGSGFSGSTQINNRITEKRTAFFKIIEGHPYASLDAIGELFKKYLDKPAQLKDIATQVVNETPKETFKEIMEKLKTRNKHKWAPGYIKRFTTITTKFTEFDADFSLENFTADWWARYVSYCIDDLDNESNTINADSKAAKKMIKDLTKEGHKIPVDPVELDWEYIEPEVKSISWDKVKRIADLDLSEPLRATYPAARTFWLIGAYTGRRSSEITAMSTKNFYKDKEGRWRYTGTVKGQKKIDVPILPEAIALLTRINFTVPVIAQQTVNSDIKEIAKAAKIKDTVLKRSVKGRKVTEKLVEEWETIHIHTGRHTFAMHLVEMSAGYVNREKWISDMLGHASFRTTWKYINLHAKSIDSMFDQIISGKPQQTLPSPKALFGKASRTDKP